VIIYGSDQKIKIIIYDKTASERVSTAPSTDKSFTRRPVSNLPTPQILEKEDSSGTEEKPSENSVVSGQESETKVPASKGGKKTKHKKLE
jgi:hypothetical protein